MAHNFWYGAAAVAAVFVGIPIVFRRLLSPGRDRTFEVRPTPKPSASSRTRSSRPVSSSPTGAPAKPRQTYDPALMQELEQVIQQFKHDSLAFFIYEESLEKNLSIEKKDILSAKYGDFGIKPSFLSYLKKGSRLLESATQLAAVSTIWLKRNGIETQTPQWESSLSNYIWTSAKNEAADIVAKVKGESGSSI